ncbi:hypothetical protein [Pseudomonas sp. NPDC087615]|uniref:hypothetical protein n=1 Tax=Pseudomonas sp. NPDC087615 TaxID=3364443 RepID=UPI00382B8134
MSVRQPCFTWVFSFCAGLLSPTVFAQESTCEFHDIQSTLEVVSCLNEGAVEVLKLAPRNHPTYESDIDRLPTFIVRGNDLDEVKKTVGMSALSSPYNLLVKLPDAEGIMYFDQLPESATKKLAMPGWILIDARDVVYGRQGGGEGFGLVCSTHEKANGSEYVVVTQCNGFYEEDIARLKNLLGVIEAHTVR